MAATEINQFNEVDILASAAEEQHHGTGGQQQQPVMAVQQNSDSSPTPLVVESFNLKIRKNRRRSSDVSNVRRYFCMREGAYDRSIRDIKASIVKPDMDGEFKESWLLIEIDHWDHEREKVVVLTEASLLVVRYDFVQEKWLSLKRISLSGIEHIQLGDFVYPPKTYMAPRCHGGIKISWQGDFRLSVSQKWNPWSSEIPWLQLCHHPIIYSDPQFESIPMYSADAFTDAIILAVKRTKELHGKPAVRLYQGSILIESYASLMSMIYNHSQLGFSRERGGVSF